MTNPSLILPQSPAFGENNVYAARVEDGAVPLYNVLPLDFTRASNGTRVNKDGFIENMPYNLLGYSEQFTTGNGWFQNKTGASTATQTSNYGIAPNGTTTADRIQLALNSESYADWVTVQTLPLVIGQVYTYSIYMKSLSGTPSIYFFSDGVANFLKTLTTEWVRYDYTFTATSTTIYPRFLLQSGSSSSADLLAWGYQLNIGSTAKPYLATTDRLDMPRITYPIGGGCGSLLLEPQRTNLALYSEQFDNADWTKTNISVTANSAISPDGTQNADTVANTGTNNTPELFQLYSGASSSTAYTLSCYMKANTHTKGVLRAYNGGSTTTPLVLFDLSEGTVIASYGNATNPTITNVGNGWYRCSMTFTTISATVGIYGHITNLSNTYTYQSSFNYVDNYNNTGSIYIWGAQLEQGSYATSYIPTTSAAATRVADACSKTGISDLIGQTEGVLFVDINYISHEPQSIFAIEDWVANGTVIRILADTSTSIGAQVYSFVGGNQYTATFNSAVNGQRYKCALAYKANDFAFYINGTQVSTSSSGTVPLTSNVRFGAFILGQTMNGQINQAVLYKTRLSNTELANLTSL